MTRDVGTLGTSNPPTSRGVPTILLPPFYLSRCGRSCTLLEQQWWWRDYIVRISSSTPSTAIMTTTAVVELSIPRRWLHLFVHALLSSITHASIRPPCYVSLRRYAALVCSCYFFQLSMGTTVKNSRTRKRETLSYTWCITRA